MKKALADCSECRLRRALTWHHFLSIELYSFSSFHKIKVNTKSKNNINYHYPDNFSMLETKLS